MKKFGLNKWVAALTVAALGATVAEATPAFARQTQMDCMSCHFQSIPKLNSFGRDFKLSGFTMSNVSEVKSEVGGGVNLPSNLNFAFITKARLHKTDLGTTNTPLKTEIFDEAALLFGGKVSENIGTSMEFGAGLLGGKFIYSQQALGGRVGAVYFMTDALGAFSGLEAYSSGLYRPVRQFENRKLANIFQKTGVGDGEATGGQIFISTGGLLATVGAYMPALGASISSGYTGFKTLARVAYETTVAGHEFSVGGYYLGGDVTTTPYAASADVAKDRTSYGLDMQTQGHVNNMHLMITGGLVLANTYSADTKSDGGFHIDAQINPIEVVGVKAAMMQFNDNKDSTKNTTNLTGGVEYNMAQNVRLMLEYTYTMGATSATSGSDILFMSMIAF
ncbi:MAG: hypothetical protein KU37_07135 [Sulfuricurvum sp. PC08-66]|nr:MAG: hypothetical protein KU37_07135 [Sulfuricurvum sp. PC08-66]